MSGVSFGPHSFSDQDFANDVALLVELLELLVPALERMTSVPACMRCSVESTKMEIAVIKLYHSQ